MKISKMLTITMIASIMLSFVTLAKSSKPLANNLIASSIMNNRVNKIFKYSIVLVLSIDIGY